MHALGHTEANTLLVIHKMDTIKDFNADSRWNMLLSVVWKLQYITWYKSLLCKYGQILVRLRNHGRARKRVSSIKASKAEEQTLHKKALHHLTSFATAPWLAAAHKGRALVGPSTAGTQVLHRPASRQPWADGQRLLLKQLLHRSAQAFSSAKSPPDSPAS